MGGFDTPEDAESAFYAAFETGDIDLMMSVWARDCDVLCIHPLGPRLTRYADIKRSWQQILLGSAPRKFNVNVIQVWQDTSSALRLVDEIISIIGVQSQFEPVLATNAYRMIDDRWYMTLHHGSLDASRGEAIQGETSSGNETRH